MKWHKSIKLKYAIYFIIALALILRLYHINFPVSGWHSWRQADTASIARNFFNNGFDILSPQIDWGGNSPGYVEAEFQLYPFLVAVLYKIFGAYDLWGRLLSLFFSVTTVYGVYLITKKNISESVALWSSFFYAILPLSIYYGRAFMPESAMLMFSVFSIYWFSRWLDEDRYKYFLFSFLSISMAVLIKLPTLYLGLPMLFLARQKYGKGFLKVWRLWLFVALVLAPVFLWYFHAHQLFLKTGLTFNIWGFGTDKWGNFDILLTLKFYNDVLFKSIAERHMTYAAFIPFIIGLFVKRKYPKERLFDWWLVAIIIYFLIVAKGNQVHEYYQLPFMLPAVVYIGKAFDKYLNTTNLSIAQSANKVQFSFFGTCFMSILILSFLRYNNLMKSETYNSDLFRLAASVQSVSRENDLIVTVSDGNPIYLYRSNRKGWNCLPQELTTDFIQQRANQGAKYVVGEKKFLSQENGKNILSVLKTKYQTIDDQEGFFILSTQ